MRHQEYLTLVCVLLALRNGPVPAKGEREIGRERGKDSHSKERKGEDWCLDRIAVNTSLSGGEGESMNVKWMLRQNHFVQTPTLAWFLCHDSLLCNAMREMKNRNL